MPWQCWSEQEVRGDAAGQPSPAGNQPYKPHGIFLRSISDAARSNMGFTAINASSTASVTGPQASRASNDKNARTSATVASEYLGRGEPQAAAASVAATSKKGHTKGKKRATTHKEFSKTKRRKSSNVDDGLHVSKVGPAMQSHEAIDPAKSTPQQATDGSTSGKENSSAAPKQPKNGLQHVGGDPPEGLSPKVMPVSVYAPTTSMDVLDSTSARTSIHSVKANAGQSITVYQDPSSSISHGSNVEFSQPWLNGATDPLAKANKKKSNAKKKTIRAQTHTDDAAVNASSSKVRRSARAKPEVSYATQSGFIIIDDTDSSDVVYTRRHSTTTRRRTRSTETIGADDGFGEIDDDDILESAMAIDDAVVNRPATPPPRGWKQNMRDVDEHEDYRGALLTSDDLKLLAQIKTKENKKDPVDRPIVRKAFPTTIRDRSPIFGASNSTLLRTCFRVGEALNTGSQAVRCNKNLIIELYARVTASWRDPPPSRKQHFVFKDLYHDKPPFLEGVYELWNQAQLWDLDSRPFLKATEKGTTARAIARMKRDGQKWRLEVLSVYEASWEDVNHVAGICNGDVQDDDDDGDDI